MIVKCISRRIQIICCLPDFEWYVKLLHVRFPSCTCYSPVNLLSINTWSNVTSCTYYQAVPCSRTCWPPVLCVCQQLWTIQPAQAWQLVYDWPAVPGGEVWSQETIQPNHVGQEPVWCVVKHPEPTYPSLEPSIFKLNPNLLPPLQRVLRYLQLLVRVLHSLKQSAEVLRPLHKLRVQTNCITMY